MNFSHFINADSAESEGSTEASPKELLETRQRKKVWFHFIDHAPLSVLYVHSW